ncbi:histone H2A 12 [Actinidia rufa]|uniref:Histone H2A n=1 Tax=Actinidia rufa TaxID=165716 RepID=A0A7J0F046_9ERIC|nr:histone H2A 12 [Actinidia rufa]
MKGGKSKSETKKTITNTLLLVMKRGAGSEKAENKPAKNGKAMKDPNRPKRPAPVPSSFSCTRSLSESGESEFIESSESNFSRFVGCNIVDLSHFRALEKWTSRTEGSWLLPVLELAENAARDNKKNIIIPRHVLIAIRNDEELGKLLAGMIIAHGRVLPHINPMLLLKKTDKAATKEPNHPPRPPSLPRKLLSFAQSSLSFCM